MRIAQNRPEIGVWREITADDARKWRSQLGRGVVRQDAIGYRDLPRVSASNGDDAVIDGGYQRRTYVEPLEVMDTLVTDFLTELRALGNRDPAAFMARIRALKATVGWAHLSDEDVARDLVGLADKLCRPAAERAFKVSGKGRQRFRIDVAGV